LNVSGIFIGTAVSSSVVSRSLTAQPSCSSTLLQGRLLCQIFFPLRIAVLLFRSATGYYLDKASHGGIKTEPLNGGYAVPRGACCDVLHAAHPQFHLLGGSRHPPLSFTLLKPYVGADVSPLAQFRYIDHVSRSCLHEYEAKGYLPVNIPLSVLIGVVPVTIARKVAKLHGMSPGSRATASEVKLCFANHLCTSCEDMTTVLSVEHNNCEEPGTAADVLTTETSGAFPPPPVCQAQAHKIITSACMSMDKQFIEEGGCGVCGQLTLLSSLSALSAIKNHLHLLAAPGITRRERRTPSDKVLEFAAAIDETCHLVCLSCRAALRNNKVPKYALAQGLWIGSVPEELACLRYIERMLVARVRHSCCCVRISSGMRKMKANAVAFRAPVPKMYDILPPPREDIQEVLAIMFTGPCKPSADDFKRTPFLVRRNHVKQALLWLTLNHIDYADIKLSEHNLAQYPEDMPPVSVEYKEMSTNKTPEGVSVFDNNDDDGTELGDCPFTVHGITGEELNMLPTNVLKVMALQHLNSQGKILAIGHAESAGTIWKNPHLYPQMFPWLFPYGLGGIGSVVKMSEREHKHRLLLYHDKRFQTDPNFPFIAFSHEQIKTSTTRSFLLADKQIFKDIAQRVLAIDSEVLDSISNRMAKDEVVKPESAQEVHCFQLLHDLDHMQGALKGTNTSKKYMRNEIWSLVNHCGAPFWYLTLSPADVKHPLCIYFAATQEQFEPVITPYEDRLRLVCRNPVACARFFNFMVSVFIKDVLGVGVKHAGAYGPVSAYYGTVEQQGRLALHLHMTIWLEGNLTPQEMRQNILNECSGFRQKLIAWVESSEVLSDTLNAAQQEGYLDPTETMPCAPPAMCELSHKGNASCDKCARIKHWWGNFATTVDDIVSKSNIHNCNRGITKVGGKNKQVSFVGCKNNKYGRCKARFPRAVHKQTEVEAGTGAIALKKLEPWINTFTPLLTYLLRCNTDVTCMWSGTAIKAVLVYITDYITKTGLKTHVIFETVKSIFDRHREIIGGTLPDKEKARLLMNKIVNLLSTKLEMGAPMVCMYLLNHPDHYTSHVFVPFYWESFVREAQCAWQFSDNKEDTHKVMLVKQKDKIVGLSLVYDYIYRPAELASMCLYDWIRCCSKKPLKLLAQKEKAQRDDSSNGDSDCSLSDKPHEKGAHLERRLPKNMYRFLQAHPLYATHGAVVKPDALNTVANFIGRPLPRSDQGDRDYYCLTMLVMFKPWRNGVDLKEAAASWDETFSSHTFTGRQLQLIQNFNIKYECLDARDDYAAEMKKKQIIHHLFLT
jgi:hypothetical protein